MILVAGLSFGAGQRFAAYTIDRLNGQQVLDANLRDGAVEDGRAVGSWQISRAISGVSFAFEGCCPIMRRVCWTRSLETRLRKGDCSSCTESPWRIVPSKTGSPVVLEKSASTILCLSVRSGVRWR